MRNDRICFRICFPSEGGNVLLRTDIVFVGSETEECEYAALCGHESNVSEEGGS